MPRQSKSTLRSTAELARRLGLSRWTVSRALNGHSGLHPATVEKIRQTAREHGFRPNLLGQSLRLGRTAMVGICLPDLVDYFLTKKITYLQEVLAERGLHPVFQITNGTVDSENAALERFAAMRCDHVVTIASHLQPADSGMKALVSAGVSVVHIDPLNPATAASVATNRALAMKLAMTHLHELGHRRLVAAGFDKTRVYGQQRLDGLRQSCRSLGWSFKNDIHVLPPCEAPDDFSMGATLAAEFLKHCAKQRFSAILALNDRVALGIIRVLQVHGFEIPKSLSVIGYDDADFSPHVLPALTTINPRVDLLIAQAVELIARRSASKRRGPSILIPPELIPRASTSIYSK